ncbi:hypothetical protein ABN303_09300 [Providencia rettgeri]
MTEDEAKSEGQRMLKENEAKLWEMFKQVTDAKFREFLLSNGIESLKCPVCGFDGMGFPSISINDGDSFLVPIKCEDLAGRYPFNPINFKYRAICKDCGYEIYFNVSRVMKWMGLFDRKSGAENG